VATGDSSVRSVLQTGSLNPRLAETRGDWGHQLELYRTRL